MGNMTIHVNSKVFPSVVIENQLIYTVDCKREMVVTITPLNGTVYMEVIGTHDIDALYGKITNSSSGVVNFDISTSAYSVAISEESTVRISIGLFQSPNSPLNTQETSIFMSIYDSLGGNVIGSRQLTHWSTDYTCLDGPPDDNPT